MRRVPSTPSENMHMKETVRTILSVCMAATLTYAAGESSYTLSWSAGTTDANGVRMSGTETMNITSHKGKLFAGTSMWMESDPSLRGCQVLVKESANSEWKVDHTFGAFRLRLTSLVSAEFSTDYRGRPIKPVRMLLAGTTTRKGDEVNVYSRDDSSGRWIPMSLGKAPGPSQVRALGSHKDKITGVELVFAGVSGTKNSPASLGLITGSHKKDEKGRLIWNKEPEMMLPARERFMGFTVCNGNLYASSTKNIWKRTDGKSATWTSLFHDPKLFCSVGLRGLSTVEKLNGQGEELMFITWSQIRRLDPESGTVTVDLDMPAFLSKTLNVPIRNTLAGYNGVFTHRDTSGGYTWLVGFQHEYVPKWFERTQPADLRVQARNTGQGPVSYRAYEARYLAGRVKDGKPVYELRTIEDPSRSELVAVRAIEPSPFPEERGRVLYMGGLDCNAVPHHDSAWIYRVEQR